MPQTKTNIVDISLKLSVLIHQDGLSFFTYNSNGKRFSKDYSFKHESNPIEILKEIESIYENEDFLKDSFSKVSLVYHHPVFTGVPQEIYQEEHQADYLKYNTRLLETDVISTDDVITPFNYKTVYIAYSNINNFFFDTYGDFDYYHYSTVALEKHATVSKDNCQVILDIKPSHFYLTIIEKDKLVLHNIFMHQAIEDILYYTLFTLEHNHKSPEEVQLQIITRQEDEKLFDLLYTYVRNVSYVENASNYIESILCV